MAVQKRLSQLGLAKQTGKGTAATAPTYVIGLTGGNVYDADISEDDLNTTWSQRGLAGRDRTSVVPTSDFEAVAMPKSIVMLLLAASGAIATTGTAPYQHTVTPANSLPWLTLFGLYGTDKVAMQDCKVDSLELSWDKTGALKVKVKAMGRTLDFSSAWTVGAGAGEVVSAGTLKGVGGVFNIDGASARVTAGSIKIENSTEAVVASSSATPDDVFEGDIKCSVSLTIVPDDLTLFRRTVTGDVAGTAVSAFAESASIDLKWVMDTNNDLEFAATDVTFAVKMPAADPAGGAAELSLEGVAVIPANGTDPLFTFTAHNNVASY